MILMKNSESQSMFTTYIAEIAVLFNLYILWTAGVVLATVRTLQLTPTFRTTDSSALLQDNITCGDVDCSMQAGLITIGWITWALMTIILMIDVVYAVSNTALLDPLPRLGHHSEHVNLEEQQQWDVRQYPAGRL